MSITTVRNGFIEHESNSGNYWIAVAGWQVAATHLEKAQEAAKQAQTTERIYTAAAIIFAAVGLAAAAAVTAAYFNVSYGIAACALVGGPVNLAIGAVAALVLAFAFGSVGESASHSLKQKEETVQKRATEIAAAQAFAEDSKKIPDTKESRHQGMDRINQLIISS